MPGNSGFSDILRLDAEKIINSCIKRALPDTAVKKALEKFALNEGGKLVLVSIGKAGWQMAKAAYDVLGDRIDDGTVITKYGHVKGPIGSLELVEAGHPVPDGNSFIATEHALKKVENLTSKDTVLFLVSGGGSALFESPLIDPSETADINSQLLASGASITEMNTIRKRLSGVKGGRFAEKASPAKVFSVILSDIIGDPVDMIASGPSVPDSSTCEDAERIVEKYSLRLSPKALELMKKETPKSLDNTETYITGSVRELCLEAEKVSRELGYEPTILTASLECEAREAGSMLSSIAKWNENTDKSLAFIMGGETVVHLRGTGLGGRNQELALSAAIGIRGMKDCAVFSVGSDGTDGPTDAAGGYVDGKSYGLIANAEEHLENNDAYHALEKSGGLIFTGPTGTNVNDVTVLLIKR